MVGHKTPHLYFTKTQKHSRSKTCTWHVHAMCYMCYACLLTCGKSAHPRVLLLYRYGAEKHL